MRVRSIQWQEEAGLSWCCKLGRWNFLQNLEGGQRRSEAFGPMVRLTHLLGSLLAPQKKTTKEQQIIPLRLPFRRLNMKSCKKKRNKTTFQKKATKAKTNKTSYLKKSK